MTKKTIKKSSAKQLADLFIKTFPTAEIAVGLLANASYSILSCKKVDYKRMRDAGYVINTATSDIVLPMIKKEGGGAVFEMTKYAKQFLDNIWQDAALNAGVVLLKSITDCAVEGGISEAYRSELDIVAEFFIEVSKILQEIEY